MESEIANATLRALRRILRATETGSRKLGAAYPSAFVVGGAVIPPEPGKVISLAGHPDELEPILAAFISG